MIDGIFDVAKQYFHKSGCNVLNLDWSCILLTRLGGAYSRTSKSKATNVIMFGKRAFTSALLLSHVVWWCQGESNNHSSIKKLTAETFSTSPPPLSKLLGWRSEATFTWTWVP